MKAFYHSFIMWIPFVLLFSCAAFAVELLEEFNEQNYIAIYENIFVRESSKHY